MKSVGSFVMLYVLLFYILQVWICVLSIGCFGRWVVMAIALFYANALFISVIPASISNRANSVPVINRTLFSCAMVMASAEKPLAVEITHGIIVYSPEASSC